MSQVTSVDTFLDVIRKSGVMDAGEVAAQTEAVRAAGEPADDPPALAASFVRRGVLTDFQAKFLLQGRWKNLVLGGKYIVLRLLGAGGMGAVYLAGHKLMGRKVALKVLPPQATGDNQAVQRFLREARAIASLDHPNIVRAFDVDQADRHYILVMEYVDGISLHHLVQQQGVLAFNQAANYTAQAALGLQHAHEHGWVHRDVKPGNLLVDRTGTVKVLDLGLARLLGDSNDGLTRDGSNNSILGTADYLAPEQAMDSSKVDIRADIYGLGCTLYYMLTGRPPFPDGTTAQKLMMHQSRQPDPLESLRPGVPEGLAAVLLKMMSKDPAGRHQTPAELAEALLPFAEGGAVPAPGSLEMASKSRLNGSTANWQLRSALMGQTMRGDGQSTGLTGPSSATLASPLMPESGSGSRSRTQIVRPGRRGWLIAATASLGALVAASMFWWALSTPGVRPADQTAPARSEATAPASRPGDTGQKQQPPKKASFTRVGEHNPNTAVEFAAFSSTAKVVATTGADGSVKFWDPAAGKTLGSVPGHGGAVRAASAAGNTGGELLLTAGADRKLRLYDVQPAQKFRRDIALPFEPSAAALSADTAAAYAAGPGGAVRGFDVSTGRETAAFSLPASAKWLAVVPDGKALVAGCDDGMVRLCALPSGERLRESGPHGGIGRGSLSADGREAYFGGASLHAWELATGKLRSWPMSPAVVAVAAAPDNRQLAVGQDGGRLGVRDSGDGREVAPLGTHAGRLTGLEYAPDGRTVLSLGETGVARSWGVPGPALTPSAGPAGRLVGHQKSVETLAFLPDGRLLSASQDGHVKLWDLPGRREVRDFAAHTKEARGLALLPGNKEFVTCGYDGKIAVWKVDGSEPPRVLVEGGASRSDLGLLPDGKRLLTADGDGAVRCWDLADGREVFKMLGHTKNARSVRSLPDGRRAVSVGNDGSARLWDLNSHKELRKLQVGTATLQRVEVSSDGKLVLVGGNGRVTGWRLDGTGSTVIYPAGRTNASGAVFLPDNRLLTLQRDAFVRILDVKTGHLLWRGEGYPSALWYAALSPDGRTLAACGQDNDIYLWDQPAPKN